ncbi:MAG: TlpA family protein disulfide reductase [Candidatus Omnitrophica bacterium]|nr:TlpA family protein disulfide reductase [Candidatus Omnitrophota bacterium]
MRKKIFLKAVSLILPAFMLVACSGSLGIASPAADLSLRDMNGNMVNLSDHKGKVIILDFFATWCPPCRQEIPDFVDLQNRYGGQGFVMIGVSLSRPDDTRPFAEALGVNYTVMIADRKTVSLYGPIRAIPVTFVIGKDFKIARKYIGYRPKEVFEKDIIELLAK